MADDGFDMNDIGNTLMLDSKDGKGKEATLSNNVLTRAFQGQQPMPSAIKYFVDPGDDLLKLLMRANFKERRMAVAVARHYAKCEIFGDEGGKKELMAIIAGECAINEGERIKILLKAVIGDVHGKLTGGSFMSKFKQAAGFGGNENK